MGWKREEREGRSETQEERGTENGGRVKEGKIRGVGER
jgi:hypothetical protein